MKDLCKAMGICECGCGQQTGLREKTYGENKKGTPYRFVSGHQNRRLIKNHSHIPAKGQFYHSGYVYVLAPKDHPSPTNKRYIKRCRLVAEMKAGRYLNHDEQVHHVNRVRDDDRPENLEIVSLAEHNRIHKTRKMLSNPARFIKLADEWCREHEEVKP